jgi:hypothetical protein
MVAGFLKDLAAKHGSQDDCAVEKYFITWEREKGFSPSATAISILVINKENDGLVRLRAIPLPV